MSGPKVVRVVTREEVMAICRGRLARVDEALAEWTRMGRRNECVDEDAIAAAVRRRDELAALIETDRFLELQKQAPVEEAFLRDDMQARLTQVAAEQAAARSRERRDREAAESLLRTLRFRGAPLDPELVAGLERGTAEALSAGFRLLAAGADRPTASADLASRLRTDEGRSTLADWLSSRPTAPADSEVAGLEARLDELARMDGKEAVVGMRTRLEEARQASSARRGLLLDGLGIESGRALAAARRRATLITDLRLLLAEAAAAGLPPDARDLGLDGLDADTLKERVAALGRALDAHRTTMAVAARRAAVLKELSGLGYEVAEGMSTSLAQEGRLVLRSSAHPDYGVELSAGGGDRMQMRAVAFDVGGTGPDPARDRDAETIWCGDVSSLQHRLAEIGSGLVIERALPVGATPLKRVAMLGAGSNAAAEAPVLRERTLR